MFWLITCVPSVLFNERHLKDHPQLCMLVEAADIYMDSKSVGTADELLLQGQFVQSEVKGMDTFS